MKPVPIIDVFAGPGGLAEGFSSLEVGGRRPFRIGLSIEKDSIAHQTLLLRGFYRQFAGDPPPLYWEFFKGAISRGDLFAAFPEQFERAAKECVCHELGAATDDATRRLVRNALRGNDGPWGLIGGPPCQAYSLAGRSRNRGIKGYVPEADHRQTLYVEYLQILADHRPSFFVMENVKGLLSATFDRGRLFERIVHDLRDPAAALRREGRHAGKGGPRYELHSISRQASGLSGLSPQDTVVRSEDHGVPQARHRVILLGVLTSGDKQDVGVLEKLPEVTVGSTLKGLPTLRSGLTDREDTDTAWRDFVRSVPTRDWFFSLDGDIRTHVRETVSKVKRIREGRGGEFVPSPRADNPSGGFANHASRGHISADLDRYFFATCFARVRGRSPTLADFPDGLLPNHRNVSEAMSGGAFADRFRVQVSDRPSTTITSHISKDGHYYIHPDPLQCRSLTVREAARLQTFPDDYFFCGPRTSQYHQVGNAVPPALARQIARIAARLV